MTLLDLIEEHPGEWEYDWRTRFRLPLSRVGGRRMSWGEAFRLALILVSDPSTRVGAARAGLIHGPVSREYQALHVLVANQNAKDTQRRPRVRALLDPFETRRLRFGAGSTRTIIDFEAALAAHRGVSARG